jgi:hypothetical protein
MKEAIHQRLYIRPGLAVMGVDLSLQGCSQERYWLCLTNGGLFYTNPLTAKHTGPYFKIFIFFWIFFNFFVALE